MDWFIPGQLNQGLSKEYPWYVPLGWATGLLPLALACPLGKQMLLNLCHSLGLLLPKNKRKILLFSCSFRSASNCCCCRTQPPFRFMDMKKLTCFCFKRLQVGTQTPTRINSRSIAPIPETVLISEKLFSKVVSFENFPVGEKKIGSRGEQNVHRNRARNKMVGLLTLELTQNIVNTDFHIVVHFEITPPGSFSCSYVTEFILWNGRATFGFTRRVIYINPAQFSHWRGRRTDMTTQCHIVFIGSEHRRDSRDCRESKKNILGKQISQECFFLWRVFYHMI